MSEPQKIIFGAIITLLLAIIGVWLELYKARRASQNVEREMKPNGGGSLRDEVNRLAGAVGRLGTKFDAVDSKVDGMNEKVVRMEAHMEYLRPPRQGANHGE